MHSFDDHHATPTNAAPNVTMRDTAVNLLDGGPVVLTSYHAQGELRPAAAARVATLERDAPAVVARARSAGVAIRFVGTSPLFAEQRFYPGPRSDWVIGPADEHEQIVIPRPQRQALSRLVEHGIDFPLTYIAHEVPKASSAELPATKNGTPTSLERVDAATLVGAVPAPAGAVELGERLGRQATHVLQGIAAAAPVVGAAILAVAAAPVVLTAGAWAALVTVDPIVFGAIPALSDAPGEPACFYQLVAWDW
jgi:hypothetical protein